ncbi:hypothetical protein C8R43DRAFT_1126391 [Mycena crocata]|nr:hypothetical protein C8R43DRAFT_1126391 [Mycena crocata]
MNFARELFAIVIQGGSLYGPDKVPMELAILSWMLMVEWGGAFEFSRITRSRTLVQYVDPTAEMGYQAVFEVPENFANMSAFEQMRCAGIVFTEESMFEALQQHPSLVVNSNNEGAVLSEVRATLEHMKFANFELFGSAPTASELVRADNIFYLAIPRVPEYLLRFYPGGKLVPSQLGSFFMDVCDSQTRQAVVIPATFTFVLHAVPGNLTPAGKMETLEAVLRRTVDNPTLRLVPEPEKFSFYEGALCELQIGGSFVMKFHAPFHVVSGLVADPVHSANFETAMAE